MCVNDREREKENFSSSSFSSTWIYLVFSNGSKSFLSWRFIIEFLLSSICYSISEYHMDLSWSTQTNKKYYLFDENFHFRHWIDLVIHQGEDIYISSLKWSSSGLYECVASNGYHSTINRSFYVSIQCKSVWSVCLSRITRRCFFLLYFHTFFFFKILHV